MRGYDERRVGKCRETPLESAENSEVRLSESPRPASWTTRRAKLFVFRVACSFRWIPSSDARRDRNTEKMNPKRRFRSALCDRAMEPSKAYQTTVDTDTFHPKEADPADTALEAVGGEGLPAPDPSGDPSVPKLDVNGGTIAFDAMGPVVVNDDGSLSRISNWSKLTERERETTQRRIAKRNAERLERLRATEVIENET